MYLIQIRRRYFSARRGYFGGLTSRFNATRFSLADATERANRTPGASVEPDIAERRLMAPRPSQI